ncbi:sterol desaturase family protein [Alteromonas sp. K632G]|jgi:sterol desaturase/sphingolipid hydroxylase (fatty acid hydroxylase superfamily)|uniref:sterol desaturase family protein n=1 Tax=Alteromonas sp. K632G TaxID=2820757 RepID=UPI000C0CF5E7|nr:sterol desaturase family protein [Alteromonas sp. K632G]MBO7922376.1 sterol desaturase family protein [Alteromonas sp. K632G]PHS44737.1 MAG: fatty acid hydroxylase [Alteromonas sp.]|tara:strand:+ start:11401 stop:12252 length:852 start_codon:yes stop_codon:yes gene_type:complete
MKTIGKWVFSPLFFLSFIFAAINIIDRTLSPAWLIPLLLLAVVVSFATEKWLPYEKVWNTPRGDLVRDIVHAVVNEGTLIITVAMIPIMTTIVPHFSVWPHQWPILLQLGFAVIVADFGITMAHYISHKNDVLWRLHAVHHSVKRMYGFNGLLKHPLHQAIELSAGTFPLLLIGMPLEIGALLGFSAAIQLLLQHSNVDMRIGALKYVWAVAPGHRHHHIKDGIKGNVNFGLFTHFWDHLLGTFVIDSSKHPSPCDGDLGIDSQPNYPKGYMVQLIEPFRSKI